jgi:hypothetical protein
MHAKAELPDTSLPVLAMKPAVILNFTVGFYEQNDSDVHA